MRFIDGRIEFMAISKAMRGTLKALTLLDVDIKKSYQVERRLKEITAHLQGMPPLYKMWDRKVFCDGHEVPVRIFLPEDPAVNEEVKSALLFFHGGGWVLGNVDSYTTVCANLAVATRHAVVSVDYRLAPEYKFPAAPEDCYAVAKEIFTNGIDGRKAENITLIGDSAGGNLAAVVSLMARDRGAFQVPRQILLYPCTANDHSEASPFASVREKGTDYLLTARRVNEMMEMYRSSDADLENPYYAPLLEKDLTNQPKTLIITAEYDPLCDEGECYAEKLKAAGNSVSVYRMRDALHGFISLPPRFQELEKAYELINRFLGEQ